MILEQLRADADRVLKGRETPSMYDWRTVHWDVVLTEEGEFQGFVPLTGRGRPGDRGRELAVPVMTRTSGDCPLLLTDSPEYVLGLMGGKKQTNRHTLFRALVSSCAAATGEQAVEAVHRFLQQLDALALPVPDEMSEKDTLTFRVGEIRPIDLPSVRSFWSKAAEKLAGEERCSICDTTGPVVASMPLPLKGGRVPDGQPSGVALVSTNAPAFHSYGLDEVPSAHLCQCCAEVTHKALNELLSGPRTHLRVGRLVYVFWASAGDYSPLDLLDHPDPDTVRLLIEAYRTGKPVTEVDEAAFHAMAPSATC